MTQPEADGDRQPGGTPEVARDRSEQTTKKKERTSYKTEQKDWTRTQWQGRWDDVGLIIRNPFNSSSDGGRMLPGKGGVEMHAGTSHAARTRDKSPL